MGGRKGRKGRFSKSQVGQKAKPDQVQCAANVTKSIQLSSTSQDPQVSLSDIPVILINGQNVSDTKGDPTATADDNETDALTSIAKDDKLKSEQTTRDQLNDVIDATKIGFVRWVKRLMMRGTVREEQNSNMGPMERGDVIEDQVIEIPIHPKSEPDDNNLDQESDISAPLGKATEIVNDDTVQNPIDLKSAPMFSNISDLESDDKNDDNLDQAPEVLVLILKATANAAEKEEARAVEVTLETVTGYVDQNQAEAVPKLILNKESSDSIPSSVQMKLTSNEADVENLEDKYSKPTAVQMAKSRPLKHQMPPSAAESFTYESARPNTSRAVDMTDAEVLSLLLLHEAFNKMNASGPVYAELETVLHLGSAYESLDPIGRRYAARLLLKFYLGIADGWEFSDRVVKYHDWLQSFSTAKIFQNKPAGREKNHMSGNTFRNPQGGYGGLPQHRDFRGCEQYPLENERNSHREPPSAYRHCYQPQQEPNGGDVANSSGGNLEGDTSQPQHHDFRGCEQYPLENERNSHREPPSAYRHCYQPQQEPNGGDVANSSGGNLEGDTSQLQHHDFRGCEQYPLENERKSHREPPSAYRHCYQPQQEPNGGDVANSSGGNLEGDMEAHASGGGRGEGGDGVSDGGQSDDNGTERAPRWNRRQEWYRAKVLERQHKSKGGKR